MMASYFLPRVKMYFIILGIKELTFFCSELINEELKLRLLQLTGLERVTKNFFFTFENTWVSVHNFRNEILLILILGFIVSSAAESVGL